MSTMGYVTTLSGAGASATLGLDFVRQIYTVNSVEKEFSDLITLTRSGSGGRFNAEGKFELVPANTPRFDYDPITKVIKGLLLESASTNLSSYSQNFGNSYWNKVRSTIIPNSEVAPDGTITADKLVEDTSASASHYVGRSHVYGSNKTLTFSVFVKAAERKFCQVVWGGFGSQVATNIVNVDLTTGEFTATGAARTRVTDFGNGWFRVSTTITTTADAGSITPNVQVCNAKAAASYTGDGVSGIYVWGQQVEQASFPSSYIPTPSIWQSRSSTATYYNSEGIVTTSASGAARSNAYLPDSDGRMQPVGLLIEGVGTNTLLQSSNYLSASWQIIGSATAGSTVSPSGQPDATLIKEPVGTANNKGIRQNNVVNSVIGNYYTASIFAKIAPGAERNFSIAFGTGSLAAGTLNCTYDLYAGNIYSQTGGIGMIKKLPNGWFRCSFTVLATAAAAVSMFYRMAVGNATNYEGDGVSGFYMWGAQLETSPIATSYIPTTTSQATRAADNTTSPQVTRASDRADVPNVQPWYNPIEGTFSIDYRPDAGGGNRAVGFQMNSTPASADIIRIRKGNTTGEIRAEGTDSDGVSQFNLLGASGVPEETRVGAVLSIKTNNASFSVNGGNVLTDTAVVMPQPTKFQLGTSGLSQMNGTISSFYYYKKALTNDQIQVLSS